jgi:hypothetical protein
MTAHAEAQNQSSLPYERVADHRATVVLHLVEAAQTTLNARAVLYDALISIAGEDELILKCLRSHECCMNTDEESLLTAEEVVDEAGRYLRNVEEALGR